MIRPLAVLALLAAVPAAAVPWTIDPAASRIGFTATWLGKPVLGRFGRWTGTIDFDPAKPASAKIDLTVDLRSAVTGDRTVDTTLPGDDWFNTAKLASARFVAASVTARGPANFVARGTLTLRGKSVAVALPFTLRIAGKTATAAGTITLDRRAFGLGISSDATAEYVAFAVPVQIVVTARTR